MAAIPITSPAPDSVLDQIGVKFNIQGENGVPLLISRGATWLLTAATFTLFLCIIWSGFQWLTSGSEKAAIQTARTRLTNCLVGLSIISLAWAVILIIQYFFGIELFTV